MALTRITNFVKIRTWIAVNSKVAVAEAKRSRVVCNGHLHKAEVKCRRLILQSSQKLDSRKYFICVKGDMSYVPALNHYQYVWRPKQGCLYLDCK